MDTELICLDDYERQALSTLDTRYGDFFAAGADDEQTLQDNRADFKKLRFRPRMMRNVADVSLSTTILGNLISLPVGIAPTSRHKLVHHLGEEATARAAKSMGTCFCLSTYATTKAAEVAGLSGDATQWFQLYIFKDVQMAQRQIQKAKKHGFKAVVVTVDLPVVGNRRKVNGTRKANSAIDGFELPPHLRHEIIEELLGRDNSVTSKPCSHLTWKDLAMIVSASPLPVIAKGILTEEDAEQAIKAGCSAVYVSNHGGRQLDGVYSSISALPEVVKAVGGRVEVYMDGGIRTGTDVLKALALGARAVFIGRPAIYGLAVGGEKGVRRVITILRDELKLAMQLSGITDVNDIPRSLVQHESLIPRL
ncbi:2-Hydroxyacid oxidase 1-like [Watersipora subatra]|uniref:2-Hydroxyacid oxidase 1-like n=1 Tax=Watersipora subatra TaxID=2589382 RepID=UPI00355AE1DB